LIIIGDGPAGLAAGIQARHVGLRTVRVERDQTGGRMLSVRQVENFPIVGEIKTLSGVVLGQAVTGQARCKGLEIVTAAARGT